MPERERTGDISVRDWFDAFDAESRALVDPQWQIRRLERLHAMQAALDGIAYAHNIPLRLMRLRNLAELDQTFTKFVCDWAEHIRRLMVETNPDGSRRMPSALTDVQADVLITAMKEPLHVQVLRNWVLRLAEVSDGELQSADLSPSLPDHYIEWFLMLLPHLERDVWLTEMGNALPVHNLARMVEHWALFVLMWAWSQSEVMRSVLANGPDARPMVLTRALGIDHLELMVMPAYKRQGRKTPELDVLMLVGPYVHSEATNVDDGGAWFQLRFHRFLERVARVDKTKVKGWDEVHEKAPGVAELADALEARATLSSKEAERRAEQSRSAWRALLEARLDGDLLKWPNGNTGRPLSRANWETMAVMACWRARWATALFDAKLFPSEFELCLSLPRHRVRGLLLFRQGRGSSSETLLRFQASAASTSIMDLDATIDLVRQTPGLQHVWIESLTNLQARLRERQQAGWAAYITAINHLLARHTRRERPEGDDDPAALLRAPPTCEEVDHLLRGFGARICRYLIGMARADLAELYWLDYSNITPRLRHVGSAERLIQHRALRQSIWDDFNNRIWESSEPGQPCQPKNVSEPVQQDMLDASSRFQIYRAASSGRIEPQPAERKAAVAQNLGGPRAVKDFYEKTVPLRDYLSIPLVYNSRVVGVLALAGMSSGRHFDTRMYPWLHTLAQDLGQTMYFHSQVWQMRQINWLASNVPLEKWQIDQFAEPDNPLVSVGRCLANVFLCPGVQIWLRDTQNKNRFKLAGCTAPELYALNGRPQDHAPSVTLNAAAATTEQLLRRPVFAFALDQWEARDVATGAVDPRDVRGRFVQAHFDLKQPKTLQYDLAHAESGEMTLGQDFLSEVSEDGTTARDSEELPILRRALFSTRGWADWMGFALVVESGGASRVIGAISLHATPLDRLDGLAGVGRRMAWPPGWRPAVAHVQTYLPYVLTQTEAIDRPLSQLVQYLLHQGRNELDAASVKAGSTKKQLQRLLAIDRPGEVHPWLRERLRSADTQGDSDMQRNLFQLQQLLQHTSQALDAQTSVEHAESLTTLWRLIENRRAIAALGRDFATAGDAHRVRWIELNSGVRKALEPFAADLKRDHIYWSIEKVPSTVHVLTQPRLWSWMLSDLMHNMAKYAQGSFEAQWLAEPEERRPSHYRLRLINEADYDSQLDQPSLLKQFGVRGSAGMARQHRRVGRDKLSRVGTGIGLWGVDQLATTLGLRFDIDIRPLASKPSRARYFFDIVLAADHVRRDGV